MERKEWNQERNGVIWKAGPARSRLGQMSWINILAPFTQALALMPFSSSFSPHFYPVCEISLSPQGSKVTMQCFLREARVRRRCLEPPHAPKGGTALYPQHASPTDVDFSVQIYLTSAAATWRALQMWKINLLPPWSEWRLKCRRQIH